MERPRHNDVALKLDSLQNDGGGGLDPAEHAAGCQGHVVYIDDYDGEAVPVCLDPTRFGHRTPYWYRHETEEQAAARLAAEEAARARREALADAATLRQSFIRNLVASKDRPPAGTLRLAVEMLVDGETGLPAPGDLAWYLGYDDPAAVDVAAVLAGAVHKAPSGGCPPWPWRSWRSGPRTTWPRRTNPGATPPPWPFAGSAFWLQPATSSPKPRPD